MNLEYIIGNNTNGANPFKIFDALESFSGAKIEWAIKRMPYQAFMNSAYWFAVSSVAKSRAGMRCQVCNNPEGIQTHHRTYDTHGKEHLNMMDLVVLCALCHGLFHGHSNDLQQLKDKVVKPKVGRIAKRTIIPHTEEDLKLPDTPIVILTKELVANCRANGGFTNSTLRALGLTRQEMKAGWPARLIGKQMTNAEYRAAAEGRYIYNSGRL